MNREVTKKMNENLSSNIRNYENMDLLDDNRKVGLAIIAREVKLLNDDEKHKLDVKLQKERLKLEKQKLESQLSSDKVKLEIETERLKIEKERLAIEQGRLIIENDRLTNEENKLKEEAKKQKVDRWINVGIKALEIGLPLAINALLVFYNFRLIYADDGRVPSELKDLMRNVYKK